MNELYPIIRRQRRPLVEPNAEVPKPEIVKSETVPVEPQRAEARSETKSAPKVSRVTGGQSREPAGTRD